ncbi:hypothetical protein D3C71_733360 [compost metagenome]
MSCLRYFSAHFLRYLFQALLEHAIGGLTLHHPALMWPLGVVVYQVAIQVCLHLLHRLIPGRPPLDTGVFIQQGSVQPLDKAIALWPAHLGCPVFNSLQLQEQLVGMMVWAPTELAPVVRQDGMDPCLVGLEKRQYRFIEHMNRGHRQLAGVEPPTGVAAIAVQHGLQIHLAHPLECADKEGVDRHQFSGVVDFYLAFAKLGAEALEQANLLVIELNGLLPVGFLEAQQAVVFGEQIVTLPHATHAAGTDVDNLQS